MGRDDEPTEEAPHYRHEAVAVILQVRDVDMPRLCVLAWQRSRAPFAGEWALPSGPLAPQETLVDSVRRHVSERLDLAAMAHLEQIGTHSSPTRDPMQRTVATAYLGLVPADDRTPLPGGAQWLPVDDLPGMAFDHRAMVQEGVARMRAKLSYSNLAFALAPETFTIATLRGIYSVALGYEVEATNLHRVLTRRRQLVETGERAPAGRAGGRPARVFRFTERRLQITDPFATLRPHAGTRRVAARKTGAPVHRHDAPSDASGRSGRDTAPEEASA